MESSTVIGAVDVFRSEVEVEVGEFVGVGAVVYFFWVEGFVHGASYASDVGHEGVAFFVRKFEEIVDVLVVGY